MTWCPLIEMDNLAYIIALRSAMKPKRREPSPYPRNVNPAFTKKRNGQQDDNDGRWDVVVVG